MQRYKKIRERVYCDVEIYYRKIRRNIRIFRISQNLTQQELADMTGLSREYISDIENDGKNKHFSIETLIKISTALDKDIKLFF